MLHSNSIIYSGKHAPRSFSDHSTADVVFGLTFLTRTPENTRTQNETRHVPVAGRVSGGTRIYRSKRIIYKRRSREWLGGPAVRVYLVLFIITARTRKSLVYLKKKKKTEKNTCPLTILARSTWPISGRTQWLRRFLSCRTLSKNAGFVCVDPKEEKNPTTMSGDPFRCGKTVSLSPTTIHYCASEFVVSYLRTKYKPVRRAMCLVCLIPAIVIGRRNKFHTFRVFNLFSTNFPRMSLKPNKM